MIVGSGLLASAFSRVHLPGDVLIMASGLSNSKKEDEAGAAREVELLKQLIRDYPEKRLVYFSTVSIEDESLRDQFYIRHKRNIEDLIQSTARRFLITRTSNIVGTSGNPATIFNYIKSRLLANEVIDVWKNAERNLLDVEDLVLLTLSAFQEIQENALICIVNPNSTAVYNIVETMALHLRVSPKVNLLDLGSKLMLPTELSRKLAADSGISFGADYLNRLLEKYC